MKESLEIILPPGAALQPGQVAIAHEAAFNAAFLSEGLTGYAVGFPGTADLEAELAMLAPNVTVADLFEYRVASSTEAFLTETDGSDIRAVGAEFKVVPVTGSKETAALKHKGLTKRLDVRQIAADPLAKEKAVASLKARLLRAEIYRAAAMLYAATTAEPKTWATGDGDTDPDADVLETIAAQIETSGVPPNRVMFATGAWIKRVKGLRAMDNAGGFANAGFSEQQLADFLGVDKVMRSRGARTVAAAGAKTKAGIIGANRVYIYNAQDSIGPEDPSNIKRFCKGDFEVYEQQISAATVDVTVAHLSLISVTSTEGIAVIDAA
ncbi:MAG: hypothetical protein PHG74_09255 [Kiritimatiellae bacterium]|nr:hypothetical protein [Kiritimatiellia bacterium]